MKKILISVLAIAMLFSLIVGCGAKELSPAEKKEEDLLKISETVDAGEKSESNEPKYFNFTAEEFVTFFDAAVIRAGFKTILSEKPDIIKKNIDNYGAVRLYKYYWETGGFLFLYADKKDDKVFRIILAADNSVLTNSNEYSLCQGLVVAMIDPKLNEKEKNKLRFANYNEQGYVEDHITIVTGENGKHIYFVSANESINDSMLILTPFEKSEESIKIDETIKSNDEKSEGNKPKYFSFSAEEFVASFDAAITSAGYETILNKKPKIEGANDSYGTTKKYIYNLGTEGASLEFFVDRESNKLSQISLHAYANGSKKLSGYFSYIELITDIIDPELSEKIPKKLNLDKITEDSARTVFGKVGQYSYVLLDDDENHYGGNFSGFDVVPLK